MLKHFFSIFKVGGPFVNVAKGFLFLESLEH